MVTIVLAVAGAAVLESLVVDLAEGLGLEALTDRLYARRGGVNWPSAVGLAVVSGLPGRAGPGPFPPGPDPGHRTGGRPTHPGQCGAHPFDCGGADRVAVVRGQAHQ